MAGLHENGHEIQGCIKGGEFLSQLTDYLVFMTSSAAWMWFMELI
jgi:hypothetical protein